MRELIHLIFPSPPKDMEEECVKRINQTNLNRTKIIAYPTFIIEILMFLRALNYSYKVGFTTRKNVYMILYLFLGFFAIIIYQVFKKNINKNYKALEILCSFTGLIILLWSVAISLMDQSNYGGVTTYIAMAFLHSTVFIIRPSHALINYTISFLILFLLMPYFQSDTNIASGHILNSLFATIFPFLISRVTYSTELENVTSKIIIENQNEQLNNLNIKLEELVITDHLTGLYNKRSFNNIYNDFWNKAKENNAPLGMIMVDIDFFKEYNDYYGHMAGDNCLKEIGKTLKNNFRRSTESTIRFGGEEFAILFLNTNEVELEEQLKKVLNLIDDLKIEHKMSSIANNLTVSAGGAVMFPTEDMNRDLLVERADRALYNAKNSGRHKYAICRNCTDGDCNKTIADMDIRCKIGSL